MSLELPVFRNSQVDFQPEEYENLNDYSNVEFVDLDEDYFPTGISSSAKAEIKVLTQNEINDVVKVLQLDRNLS